jgi:hypothetical protein
MSAVTVLDHLPATPGCRIGRPRPVDFRSLLGRVAWYRLPEAVRRRFDETTHHTARAYPGRMVVRANPAGRLLAHVLRLVGTPLAPFTGEDVPCTVEVRGDGQGGIVWEREYRFPGHAALQVASTKRSDLDGRLVEVVRGGLGMTLTVSVEDGALHFRSDRYFAEILGLRIWFHPLLTPGAAHVVHEDRAHVEGPGWFRFALRFRHPWLGETFFQEGLFRDPLDLTPETRPS